MALQRDRAEWNRVATIVAAVQNINAKDAKDVTQPEDVDPYRSGKQRGGATPLTRDNIGILKAIV